jgi:hypothetical protein
MAKVVWTGADGAPRELRTSEYPVTIVTRRGSGWRNLHTFEFRHEEWVRATPRTARQGRQPERRGGSLHEPIPEGTVELTDKLSPQREHLFVILNALRGVGRHKVDVADISRVVSQLASPFHVAIAAAAPRSGTRCAGVAAWAT